MIFRAPEQPVVIPEVPLTEFLLERAASRGDKAAFVDGPSGRTLTYRGWSDAVRRTAAGLARQGLRKGHVFAIYSPNLPEYAIAFHAVSLLGGVVTTINPTYTVDELTKQLKDARARFLVTTTPFLEKAQQSAREAGVEKVFVFGESFEALQIDGDVPQVGIDPRNDVVALPYSSGTTGLPKGVMLTHYNLVANVLQSYVLGVRESDVLLGVLPFFHIYGMVVIMNVSLHAGSTIVTMPKFDLEQCLETLQKYRITYANVVPPIVLAFAKSPLINKYDLSSLRLVFSGAAPLGPELTKAAAERLHCVVTQGYGMTEASPVTHVARVGTTKSAGIGPPLPNTESKIVDVETGKEVGANEQGEICVRGPQVMKGYLNRPDATAAMIDDERWLHTGDIGYADDNGCFFVVDRVKELIKYKGMQIAPAELEAVLLTHPCVADCAVVPLADDEAGQVPKGYVVLKSQATSDQIMVFVAERVAPYKRLRILEITDQIPRSPSGKILRRVLVERQA